VVEYVSHLVWTSSGPLGVRIQWESPINHILIEHRCEWFFGSANRHIVQVFDADVVNKRIVLQAVFQVIFGQSLEVIIDFLGEIINTISQVFDLLLALTLNLNERLLVHGEYFFVWPLDSEVLNLIAPIGELFRVLFGVIPPDLALVLSLTHILDHFIHFNIIHFIFIHFAICFI